MTGPILRRVAASSPGSYLALLMSRRSRSVANVNQLDAAVQLIPRVMR